MTHNDTTCKRRETEVCGQVFRQCSPHTPCAETGARRVPATIRSAVLATAEMEIGPEQRAVTTAPSGNDKPLAGKQTEPGGDRAMAESRMAFSYRASPAG